MQVLKFFGFAAFLASVHGHFLLNYPQTRGFDEDKEPTVPCGGFPLASNRSQFPLSGGIVSITSKHPKSDIIMLVSFDSDPTTFAEFNKTSTGATIPPLKPFTQMNAEGDACFPVNFSSLGVPEAKNGANATILIQFNGGDGNLYQCADVVLSNSFSVPPETKCSNVTGAFSTNGEVKFPVPKITTGFLGALASSLLIAVF